MPAQPTSHPNPEPPRRSSMRLKRKLEQEIEPPSPKRIRVVYHPTDSGLLPSTKAPLLLTHSNSKVPSSTPTSLSNAGASSEVDSSNAGPCRCTTKDRQEALIEACQRLAILCNQEDLDWSLLFAMQGLYRPLERRIKAWEAEPIPKTLEDRTVGESDREGKSEGP